MNSHDELLRHDAFLRRLARGLTGSDGADDLAQETWVAALRFGATPEGPGLRAWLARVARNLTARGAERDAARRARELDGERRLRAPSPDEVAARMALQRLVVEAVEALEEPYRRAVFLRYFEGLSPAQIAERDGTPVATVKTRLKRARAALKRRLDREAGGREAWSLTLAGALHGSVSPPTAAATTTIGGIAMATKGMTLAGAAAIALTGGALWLTTREDARRADPQQTAALAPRETPSDPNGGRDLELRESAGTPERDGLAPEPAQASRPAPAAREEEPVEEPAPTIEPAAVSLHGRVVHAEGPPAVGATVVLGDARATTDAFGRFELRLDFESGPRGGPGGDAALVAVKHGYSPAVVAGYGARARTAAERDDLVELVIPGEAGEISGVVYDADGSPAEGWRVKLLDGTVIAEGDFFPLTAEEVADDPEAAFVLDHRRVTNAAGGVSPSAWRRGFHETDELGRFDFAGLELDRTYVLRAWNERTLQVVESEPIPTGARGVALYAPTEPPRPFVDGVVVGTDGAPLAGVRCRLTMVEHRTASGTWMTSGQTVRTGPDGAFRFVDVPRVELFVRFDGHGGGTHLDLAPAEEYRGVRVVLERPGRFRLAGAAGTSADEAAVLDAAGETLRVRVENADGETRSLSRLPVLDGRSPAAEVSESARLLVLYREGREVGRRALAIRPGEEVVVRW